MHQLESCHISCISLRGQQEEKENLPGSNVNCQNKTIHYIALLLRSRDNKGVSQMCTMSVMLLSENLICMTLPKFAARAFGVGVQ